MAAKDPPAATPAVTPAVSRFMAALGKKGGEARAQNLGKKQLRAAARHAASFRWPKAKKKAP